MEPDALVDLERRLMAAKIEEAARAIKVDDGLASRLARARARIVASEVVDVFDILSDAASDARTVVSAPAAGLSFAEELAASNRPPALTQRRLSAPPAPAPPPPKPILPRPEPRPFTGGDWSASRNRWPERQAFADGGSNDFDLNPYDSDPNCLLSKR